MGVSILAVLYIVAAITFIMGLKMMSNPATARKGNTTAGIGMLFAIFGTIFLLKMMLVQTSKTFHGYSAAW